MIRFDHVSFRYDERWVVRDLDVHVVEGELLVVVGPTGSGKSTVLKLINGLVPHFSGGDVAGDVLVEGRSVMGSSPAELADLVGFVGQDPASSFVAETVEDEIAYAMENLGVAPAAMRRRVEDALDLMSLHDVRSRSVRSLSGGQQQRVAIAAVLASSPAILVLDEPTSALDPGAAEEVLSSLTRLVHDVGLTVVMAEHRLERVLPFADRVLLLDGAGGATIGEPAQVMAASPLAPPLIELGRLAGWEPLPVTVRQARRQSGGISGLLGDAAPPRGVDPAGRVVAKVEDLTVAYGDLKALDRVSATFTTGTVTALMGRNGSGKSTLLGTIAGLLGPTSGVVEVSGQAPRQISAEDRICLVGLVPQDPGLLLYAQEVADECRTADLEHHLTPGTTSGLLGVIADGIDPLRHPKDLSEGQRLSLALSVVLAPRPLVVLLDEPTRGLDYQAKRALCAQIRMLRDSGTAVVMASHDVELVAMVADRVVVLAGGEVIADGATRDVVCHTPAFAPQVAKVLSPQAWLTVDEVATALQEVRR